MLLIRAIQAVGYLQTRITMKMVETGGDNNQYVFIQKLFEDVSNTFKGLTQHEGVYCTLTNQYLFNSSGKPI